MISGPGDDRLGVELGAQGDLVILGGGGGQGHPDDAGGGLALQSAHPPQADELLQLQADLGVDVEDASHQVLVDVGLADRLGVGVDDLADDGARLARQARGRLRQLGDHAGGDLVRALAHRITPAP